MVDSPDLSPPTKEQFEKLSFEQLACHYIRSHLESRPTDRDLAAEVLHGKEFHLRLVVYNQVRKEYEEEKKPRCKAKLRDLMNHCYGNVLEGTA